MRENPHNGKNKPFLFGGSKPRAQAQKDIFCIFRDTIDLIL